MPHEIDEQPYQLKDIFDGIPADDMDDDIPEPEINESDFDTEEKELAPDPDDSTLIEETEEKYHSDDEPDVIKVEAETVRQEELNDKAEEIKRELKDMLDPEIIVGFIDFIQSRGMPVLMKKTDRKDWRFDEDELEFFTKCLKATILEGKIELWPAWVWFLVAWLFITAMNLQANYTKYYSKKAQEIEHPKDIIERSNAMKEAELAEIEAMENKLEVLERKAALNAKIQKAEQAIRENVSIEEIAAKLKETGVNSAEEPEESEHFIQDELRRLYPEDEYVYENGELQYRQDGQPKKRPGRKKGDGQLYKHPLTKQFISKEEYYNLVESGHIDAEGDWIEHVEAEEVA